MKNDIGIGMAGCGGMGRFLVKLLLELEPRVKLRALFDPDPRSIAAARAEFGAGVPADTDYGAFLARPGLDWVMIASWNCFHKEQAMAAFAAGKHVFCQKPLATRFADCLEMRRAWQESGRQFVIGFTLRFSPHYRQLKAMLDAGAVGKIVSFEFNETLNFNHGGFIMGDWRRLRQYAGTHLLEKCCHDIDLANWFTGSLPARVASFGGVNFFTPENRRHVARLGRDSTGREAYLVREGLVNADPFTGDKDIVDNQVAIIEYLNGVRATFHTNCNAGIPERRMYILGTEGAIRANVLTGDIETQRIGFDSKLERVASGIGDGHGGGDTVMARELAATMFTGAPPAAGLDAGLASAGACFAIDEAMDTGRVVDARPLWRQAGLLP
ncbi:MAG: Gfo/Idh/MocA family oxidoreductase [Lentisphaeria bacterium]